MKSVSKIGPYEIIREIGRGGMGVVYLAKHPTLGIDVALKAMFPDPSRGKDDPAMIEARKRFKNEAKITARLKDIHIVNIYDFGVDEESGILFIVMDYLDGGTLKDKLKEKGKFTLDETLKIIKPIAEALSGIHDKGIIHRDLKPSNIMFLGDKPVLTDFGIAKDAIESTILTDTGKLVGSIPYMSPERIDEEPFDHRADIYALGVIVYEMLTGENPFAANTNTGVMKKVATYDPPLISNQIRDIPPEFAYLINLLIKKEPFERLGNLTDLSNFNLSNIQADQIKKQHEKEKAEIEAEAEIQKKREAKERGRSEKEEEARRREQESVEARSKEKEKRKQKEEEEKRKQEKRRLEDERKKREEAQLKAVEEIRKSDKKTLRFVLCIMAIIIVVFVGKEIMESNKPANSRSHSPSIEYKSPSQTDSSSKKSSSSRQRQPVSNQETSKAQTSSSQPVNQKIPAPKTKTIKRYEDSSLGGKSMFVDYLERAWPGAQIEPNQEYYGANGPFYGFDIKLKTGLEFQASLVGNSYPGQDDVSNALKKHYFILIYSKYYDDDLRTEVKLNY